MKRKRLTITIQDEILKRLDRFIDGDKIRNRSHAIEVLLSKRLKNQIIKKAIIMGRGDGVTIYGKEVSHLLLPLNGKTLIEHNIEFLKKFGITDFIISMGKLDQQVRDTLGDGSKYGIKVIYYVRDLGRGGVLRQAKSLLEDTFLMMNGDILLENIDLRDMYYYHKANRGQGTVLLTTVADPSRLGTVRMKGNRITEFAEKPVLGRQPSQIINAGVYLLEPAVCELVSPEEFSMERFVFPTLAAQESLYGYMMDGDWIHLHDKELFYDYQKAHNKE